jgi:hypothetical protein
MRKGGVEAKPWHHDVDAVGPDNAQEMRLCRVERGLLQCLTLQTQFAKTSRNDYRGACATGRQLTDQRRDRAAGVTMTARSGVCGRLATFG